MHLYDNYYIYNFFLSIINTKQNKSKTLFGILHLFPYKFELFYYIYYIYYIYYYYSMAHPYTGYLNYLFNHKYYKEFAQMTSRDLEIERTHLWEVLKNIKANPILYSCTCQPNLNYNYLIDYCINCNDIKQRLYFAGDVLIYRQNPDMYVNPNKQDEGYYS